MERHVATPKQKRAAIVSALLLAAMALAIYFMVIAKFVVYG